MSSTPKTKQYSIYKLSKNSGLIRIVLYEWRQNERSASKRSETKRSESKHALNDESKQKLREKIKQASSSEKMINAKFINMHDDYIEHILHRLIRDNASKKLNKMLTDDSMHSVLQQLIRQQICKTSYIMREYSVRLTTPRKIANTHDKILDRLNNPPLTSQNNNPNQLQKSPPDGKKTQTGHLSIRTQSTNQSRTIRSGMNELNYKSPMKPPQPPPNRSKSVPSVLTQSQDKGTPTILHLLKHMFSLVQKKVLGTKNSDEIAIVGIDDKVKPNKFGEPELSPLDEDSKLRLRKNLCMPIEELCDQDPVIDFHFYAECPDDDSERILEEIQCGCETDKESASAVIHKTENKPIPNFIHGMDMIKPKRTGGGLRLSRRWTKKGIGSSSLKIRTT